MGQIQWRKSTRCFKKISESINKTKRTSRGKKNFKNLVKIEINLFVIKLFLVLQVFEKQYTDWRKQFDEWKEKHRNHPNKTQFNQYEKQVKFTLIANIKL